MVVRIVLLQKYSLQASTSVKLEQLRETENGCDPGKSGPDHCMIIFLFYDSWSKVLWFECLFSPTFSASSSNKIKLKWTEVTNWDDFKLKRWWKRDDWGEECRPDKSCHQVKYPTFTWDLQICVIIYIWYIFLIYIWYIFNMYLVYMWYIFDIYFNNYFIYIWYIF